MSITNKQVITVLEKSRDLISNGWCRELYERDINGRKHYCAVGAIQRTTISIDLRQRAYASLTESIHHKPSQGEYDINAIIQFNDAQKGKQRVISKFNQAIASLR